MAFVQQVKRSIPFLLVVACLLASFVQAQPVRANTGDGIASARISSILYDPDSQQYTVFTISGEAYFESSFQTGMWQYLAQWALEEAYITFDVELRRDRTGLPDIVLASGTFEHRIYYGYDNKWHVYRQETGGWMSPTPDQDEATTAFLQLYGAALTVTVAPGNKLHCRISDTLNYPTLLGSGSRSTGWVDSGHVNANVEPALGFIILGGGNHYPDTEETQSWDFSNLGSGTAPFAYFTLIMSDGVDVVWSDHSYSEYPKGSVIWNRYGYQTETTYKAVEWIIANLGPGSSSGIIQVTMRYTQPGDQWIMQRVTMDVPTTAGGESTTYAGETEYWGETEGVQDQQGWYSIRAPIHVYSPPQLSNGYVSPPSGTTSTNFYYYVTYYDADPGSPSTTWVNVDGSFYTMSLYSGSASNGVYWYGPKTLGAGSHSYYFYFEDAQYVEARLPPSSGSYSGPSVVTPPTVTTNAATLVEEATATVNGAVNSDGGEACQYRFEYDTSSGEPYAYSTGWTGSKSTGQSFSEPLSSLSKGTKYYFRAQAKNSAGTASGSELTFLTKPDAPTSFGASAAGSTRIDLSWSKGAGAQKTKIQRKQGSYPANKDDGTQVYYDTGTTCPDTGLTPNTTYYYRAWSYVQGSEQWSDSYAQASATTPLGITPPTVTTNAATLAEETTATLNGVISSDGGEACQYRFEYDTSSGEPYAYSTGWTGSKTTGQSFSEALSSLSKGTKYYFRAQAKNSAGTASGSELTLLTKPDAPTSFSATPAGSTQIDLSWTKGAGAQKTKVQRKQGGYPASKDDGIQVYFDTGTAASDTGLTPNTTYYYRAWSYVQGSEQWSDSYAQASATTGPEDIPPTLSNGYVDPTSGDTSTSFYYYVSYYDADGDSPIFSYVNVDGSLYTMSLYSGTASNGVYQYGPMNLSTDSHYYYFYFGYYKGDTVTVKLPPSVGGTYSGPSVTSPNIPPILSNGYVDPTSGDTSTSFCYYVSYYDADGDSPGKELVLVDGSHYGYVMSLYSGTASNGVYRYGPMTLGAGSHSYYFLFTDGNEHQVTLPSEGSHSGPSVTAPNNPPQLSSGYVDPTSGTTSTNFYYYVSYYDADGDSPGKRLVHVDGSFYGFIMSLYSGTASNGVYRYGPVTLGAGSHDYYFFFDDGNGHPVRLPPSDTYSGPPVSAPGGVNISLQPTTKNVGVSDVFDLVIQAEAGDQPVSGIAAFVNFVPAYLEVQSVTPGASLPTVIQNTYDNTAGTIDYSAGKLGEPSPTGTFTVATVQFRAKAMTSPSTALTFSTDLPRETRADHAGGEVTGTITGGTVYISSGARVDISVVLQGGSRPSGGWGVPITIKFFSPGANVMTDTPLEQCDLTTTKSGSTAICQCSVAPGTYDITAVSEHTLLNVKRNVVISAPSTAVYMGTLLEGNANDDGIINISDFGILAESYMKMEGEPGYDARADFDRNGIVNITDFGLLADNYVKMSPIDISG